MGQNSGKQLTLEGREILLKELIAESIYFTIINIAGCAYVWKAVDVNNSQQNYVLKVTKWNSNDTKMIERTKINIIMLVYNSIYIFS